MDISFTPVQTKRASEAICDQIREMILNGEIRYGDRLPSERTMMQMFQRSRPTIREALRMLERSGMIRITAGSGGAVVLKPSSSTVEQPLEDLLSANTISNEELLEYRRLNETAVAGWAAERRTDEDLAQLSQCLQEAKQAAPSYENFAKYDIRFHQLIAAASKNRLSAMLEKIAHRIVLNKLSGAFEKKDEKQREAMIRSINRQHRAICEAILASDSAAAQEAMKKHLSSFESDVLASH